MNAEVEDWGKAQQGEHRRVRRFNGSMRGEHEIHQARLDHACEHGTR